MTLSYPKGRIINYCGLTNSKNKCTISNEKWFLLSKIIRIPASSNRHIKKSNKITDHKKSGSLNYA